jgi:integrase
MSLFKRGNVWWSRIVIDKTVYVQSLKTRNKDEARQFEAMWRADRLRGEYGLRKAPTFSEYATPFINSLVGRVSRGTFKAYVSRLAYLLSFPKLADVPMDKLDVAAIEEFRTSRKAAAGTINGWLKMIRMVTRKAVKDGVIRKAPHVSLLTDEAAREFVLDEATLKRFLDRAPTPMHRAMWLTLYDTGLRVSEACALTWADYDGDAVHVRKGKSKNARRRVPVTSRVRSVIESLPRHEFIFSRQGRSVNRTWASHSFGDLRKELGLPKDCVLHSLRHSYLTRLGNLGVSPFVLQKLAGHSNIAMTARYSHPDDAQLTAAIALLD